MRKISEETAQALKECRKIGKGNTMVKPIIDELLYGLYLHGNQIATNDTVTGNLYLYDCGWQSNTTKERLNAILKVFNVDAYIYQKNFAWYLSYKGVDVLWTGEYSFAVNEPLVEA